MSSPTSVTNPSNIFEIEVHQLPRASHQFLDAQGLLRARLCASVTAKEAAFADALRRGAFLGTASEVCRWLPRTPAVAYIRGRIMLDIGQADQAAAILERLAGTLGANTIFDRSLFAHVSKVRTTC